MLNFFKQFMITGICFGLSIQPAILSAQQSPSNQQSQEEKNFAKKIASGQMEYYVSKGQGLDFNRLDTNPKLKNLIEKAQHRFTVRDILDNAKASADHYNKVKEASANANEQIDTYNKAGYVNGGQFKIIRSGNSDILIYPENKVALEFPDAPKEIINKILNPKTQYKIQMRILSGLSTEQAVKSVTNEVLGDEKYRSIAVKRYLKMLPAHIEQKMRVAGRFTFKQYPKEMLLFKAAEAILAFSQLKIDAANNVVAYERFFEGLKDPVGYISFYFFMIGARATSYSIAKMSPGQLKKVFPKYANILGLPMGGGMYVSHIVTELLHSSEWKMLYKSYTDPTIYNNPKLREEAQVAARESLWNKIFNSNFWSNNSYELYTMVLSSMAASTTLRFVTNNYKKGMTKFKKTPTGKWMTTKVFFVNNVANVGFRLTPLVGQIANFVLFFAYDPIFRPVINEIAVASRGSNLKEIIEDTAKFIKSNVKNDELMNKTVSYNSQFDEGYSADQFNMVCPDKKSYGNYKQHTCGKLYDKLDILALLHEYRLNKKHYSLKLLEEHNMKYGDWSQALGEMYQTLNTRYSAFHTLMASLRGVSKIGDLSRMGMLDDGKSYLDSKEFFSVQFTVNDIMTRSAAKNNGLFDFNNLDEVEKKTLAEAQNKFDKYFKIAKARVEQNPDVFDSNNVNIDILKNNSKLFEGKKYVKFGGKYLLHVNPFEESLLGFVCGVNTTEELIPPLGSGRYPKLKEFSILDKPYDCSKGKILNSQGKEFKLISSSYYNRGQDIRVTNHFGSIQFSKPDGSGYYKNIVELIFNNLHPELKEGFEKYRQNKIILTKVQKNLNLKEFHKNLNAYTAKRKGLEVNNSRFGQKDTLYNGNDGVSFFQHWFYEKIKPRYDYAEAEYKFAYSRIMREVTLPLITGHIDRMSSEGMFDFVKRASWSYLKDTYLDFGKTLIWSEPSEDVTFLDYLLANQFYNRTERINQKRKADKSFAELDSLTFDVPASTDSLEVFHGSKNMLVSAIEDFYFYSNVIASLFNSKDPVAHAQLNATLVYIKHLSTKLLNYDKDTPSEIIENTSSQLTKASDTLKILLSENTLAIIENTNPFANPENGGIALTPDQFKERIAYLESLAEERKKKAQTDSYVPVKHNHLISLRQASLNMAFSGLKEAIFNAKNIRSMVYSEDALMSSYENETLTVAKQSIKENLTPFLEQQARELNFWSKYFSE